MTRITKRLHLPNVTAQISTTYRTFKAKIGKNLRIQSGVTLANDVAIGANAVVVKDILEEATSHAGVPTHKTSNHSSAPYIDKKIKREQIINPRLGIFLNGDNYV